MEQRLILDEHRFQITLERMAHQLVENHGDFTRSVILGMQPRGIHLAKRIAQKLKSITNTEVPLGYLDVTFHRDDFRRRDSPLTPSVTHVPFTIEKKEVILIDDVLYTGRTVRSALDAMITFGRPDKVELMVLVDRKYQRDLPIQPHYVGWQVNTMKSQHVIVKWQEAGEQDQVWLETKKN